MIRLPVCVVALALVLVLPTSAAATSDARPEGPQDLPQPATLPASAPQAVDAPQAVEPSEPPSEAAPAVPAPAPASASASAIASWFGPGLYGNRTACGLTLTSALPGVAHRSLPCGSLVTLRYGSSLVTVPVVDRGPYSYGREFDLTFATKTALGCPDLCRLAWLR